MDCQVSTIETFLGFLTLVQTANGVRFVDLDDGARQFAREACGSFTRIAGVPSAQEQLVEYFSGTRQTFDVPLDLCGTPFQTACWRAMLTIPYGSTATYAQQAALLGTRAYRAVGQANRRNPIPIFLPCHRIVGKDSPGGYFGKRTDLKKSLLLHEGAYWPPHWDD